MSADEQFPLAPPLASNEKGSKSPEIGAQRRASAGNTPREPRTRRPTERLSRLGLDELAEELSPRDWLVLQAVADHRFLTTKHVERLIFTAHASPTSAARSCRRVTELLSKRNVLRGVQRRIGGIRAGSAAQVWTTGAVGRRLLAMRDADTPRRHAEPSERFLRHALAIADTHVALVEADRRHDIELLRVQLEPACWRPFLSPSGSRAVLQPDLAVTTGAGEYEDAWFIEVDLGNEHIPTLIRKCQQYEAYRRTGHEQQVAGSFPWVVWLLDSDRRVDSFQAALSGARDVDRDLFRLMTPDGLLPLITNDN